MKNSILITVAIFAALVSLFPSCKKGNKCDAGTGGNVTVIATLKHHSKIIPSQANYLDTVYVKFNTSDFPGSDIASYDAYFVGSISEIPVRITGLKCGQYYLYGAGFDTVLSDRVKGGVPFSTELESGEVSINIPVTEVH
jgi:hypothetical protein